MPRPRPITRRAESCRMSASAHGSRNWQGASGFHHKTPDATINVRVACGDCGDIALTVDGTAVDALQPGPGVGFSAFFADHQDDMNPGGFVFGGFAPKAANRPITVSSPYGTTTFAAKTGAWGARLQFADAPIGKPFTVVVSAPGVDARSYTLTRTR